MQKQSENIVEFGEGGGEKYNQRGIYSWGGLIL